MLPRSAQSALRRALFRLGDASHGADAPAVGEDPVRRSPYPAWIDRADRPELVELQIGKS